MDKPDMISSFDVRVEAREELRAPRPSCSSGTAVHGPRPRFAADDEAVAAMAVSADEQRIAVELVDTVIRDLFGVGLTLHRALGQASVWAAEPVTEAIDGIDRVIRSIRDVVFGLSRPASPIDGD